MIIFHSIVPERNRYRLYGIDLQPCLFGGYFLTTIWDRIGGSRKRGKEYWYETESCALNKAQSIMRKRVRHNYRLVSGKWFSDDEVR